MSDEKKTAENEVPERTAEESPAEEAPESPAPAAAEDTRAHRDHRRGGFGFFLLLVLVLGLAGAGGYFGYQQLQSLQGRLSQLEDGLQRNDNSLQIQQSSLAEVQARLNSLNPEARISAAVRDLESRLDARLQPLEAEHAETERHLAELHNAVSQTHAMINRDQRGWVLAEVEYLLGMAQQRLFLAHDYDGAERALRAADQRLFDLADPALLGVREAISEDLTRLLTHPRPDIEGQGLRLKQLAQSVDQLPPRTAAGESEILTDEPSAAPQEEPQTWLSRLQQFGQNAWHNLRGLVVVKHHGRELDPRQRPTDQVYIDRELHLQLIAARLGLLARDAQTFDRHMGEALALLEKHYDTTDPRVQRVRESLSRLRQSAHLERSLPDISGSLQRLRQIMNSTPAEED